MRYFYTVVLYLAMPLLLLRLAARGLRHGDYHRRWHERFGFFRAPGVRDCLWVHAVSLGEVNAAEPLIKAMMERYRQMPMVVTTGTPTGSDRVRQLFGERVFHVYLPFDLPFAVRRFLRRIRPRLGVVVETEIWPNLYAVCRQRGVPLMIANARLSKRSLRGYAPVQSLLKTALGCVGHVAAQSRLDAARYRLLGAQNTCVSVVGNLKFDMPLAPGVRDKGHAMRAAWGAQRPVWMIASTHEGEELAALKAHRLIIKTLPDALLLLAPRHPERFQQVEQLLRSQDFRLATRRADAWPGADTQCFLIDAMGELLPFYAAADVAFVGGSLARIGGHNVLEPAALAKPVLVGPYTYNFEGITETLVKRGAALRITSGEDLGPAVLELLRDDARRTRMGEAARDAFDRERGAVARVMTLVDEALESTNAR
ncbi:MAG TPA: lipid IV(A) 3-deoxy-D-manno-octulosonic acid transferase [Oleiagrimonas sp.]|nr:lipid IV(A) 3-deoxy-D-manno-octulosonic acid transferase [Oleiagrimonas sp.]